MLEDPEVLFLFSDPRKHKQPQGWNFKRGVCSETVFLSFTSLCDFFFFLSLSRGILLKQGQKRKRESQVLLR